MTETPITEDAAAEKVTRLRRQSFFLWSVAFQCMLIMGWLFDYLVGTREFGWNVGRDSLALLPVACMIFALLSLIQGFRSLFPLRYNTFRTLVFGLCMAFIDIIIFMAAATYLAMNQGLIPGPGTFV